MQEKDGLLLVDKAAGMTSFDVVRQVRRLAGTRKVGHTGTLDPDATGLLAIALGRCTKLARFVMLEEKIYAFTMEFGAATDTDDVSGEVLRRAPWEHIDRPRFEAALRGFRGEIEQVPPVYSAIKVDGERAYARARAGEEVKLKARPVMISEIGVTEWDLPRVSLTVRCGSGTYVRSLARDLGEALDSAAHTTMIRRLAVGPFSIDGAVRLEGLTGEDFWSHVLSPLSMVQSLPMIEVDAEKEKKIRFGQPIVAEGSWALEEAVAAHDRAQKLVAIMECREREGTQALLWPRRVMA